MKIGIIGTSLISDVFMESVVDFPDLEVVAVCSGHYENAIKFKEKYHLAYACKSFDEMDMVDAVYIGTPNAMHCEHSMYFLNKGKHVYCEKPLASNDKEVKKMIECAKENHVTLFEGLLPVYQPGYKVLKENLSRLGPIHNGFIQASKYSSRYDAYLNGSNPPTFRNELSNGAIMDMGVYSIGIALALFGKPEQILASGQLLESKVDSNFDAIFKYKDKNIIVSSTKVNDTNILSEIGGEYGVMQLPNVTRLKEVLFYPRVKRSEKDSHRGKVEIGGYERLFKTDVEVFHYTIEAFKKACEKGTDSEYHTYEDMILLHETLTEIRRQVGVKYKMDQEVL